MGFKRKLKLFRSGFTLIEVLVTVAIIAILSSFIIANLLSFRERGRDTQRKNDLRVIANALEAYSNEKGRYVRGFCPNPGTAIECNYFIEIQPFLKNGSLPKDPRTNENYGYQSDELGSYYRLYAKLENCNDFEILPQVQDQCKTVVYNYGLFSNTQPVAYGGLSPTALPTPATPFPPTATPTGFPTSAPTGTPTPTPTFLGACADGTDDGRITNNMVRCVTGTTSINQAQAPQLCALGWHVCSVQEYVTEGGSAQVCYPWACLLSTRVAGTTINCGPTEPAATTWYPGDTHILVAHPSNIVSDAYSPNGSCSPAPIVGAFDPDPITSQYPAALCCRGSIPPTPTVTPTPLPPTATDTPDSGND